MPKPSHTNKYFMGVLLLTTYAALTQGVLEPDNPTLPAGDQYADNPILKENDMITVHKRPAFFVGSRYGRAGGPSASGSGNAPKTRRLIVVPRNDRFFLGSRYGKRSGSEYVSPYEQNSLNMDADNALHNNNNNNNNANIKQSGVNGNKPAFLSCTFTGIGNYYRCNNADEIDNFINQLASTHNFSVSESINDETK